MNLNISKNHVIYFPVDSKLITSEKLQIYAVSYEKNVWKFHKYRSKQFKQQQEDSQGGENSYRAS